MNDSASSPGDGASARHECGELLREDLRYQALVRAIGQTVWSWRPDGVASDLAASHQWWEELTGQSVPTQETSGEAWLDVVHPDDRGSAAASWNAARIAGTSYAVEYRVKSRQGGWRHVRARGVPIIADDKSVQEWIGTLEEVTVQHEAEAERERLLAEVEAERRRLEEVFQHAPSFIAVLRGPDHVFERVNEHYVKLIGGRDVVGLPVREALPEIEGQGYFELLDQVYQSGEPHIAVDARVVFANAEAATERILQFVYQPLFAADASVAGVIAQGIDSTEQRQAEAGLVRVAAASDWQRRMYETALSNSADFIYLFNTVGEFTYVNKTLLDRWGADLSEVVGRTFLELDCPHDLATRLQRQIEEVVANGQPVRDETPFPSPSGTADYEYIFTPVFGVDGRVEAVAGSTRDVTERKRLEERLRQSEKIEAIGQLAGGVAHDFNNMLAVIIGYSASLSQSDRLDDAEQGAISEIRAASERAAGLTRQLLAFSRQQVLKPKIVNLNEVIGETMNMLSRLIGEDVRIDSLLKPALWPVRIDPGQFQQILLNLAINARDAMPQGGVLTIETINFDTGESSRDANQRFVKLSVRDTGCGMDKAVRERAFEPFFTTKEKGRGTGLGLASVYGIVQQSGGQITLDSERGRGTAFTILFPAILGEVCDSEEETAERDVCERGSETLLVVEDEEMVRRLLCKVLVSQGYTVLEASGGSDALEHWKAHQRDIDLVISDVIMPVTSGRQLVDQLRLDRSDLKVLLMSGYTDDAVMRHNVEEHSVHFIQKPFSPLALAAKVREILASDF